jgi:hypothetical protein
MANVFKKLTTYFKGRDDMQEEVKEAKAVKAGKITPKQYAKGEKMEGEKAPAKKLVQTAKKIQSGKMTAKQYASSQKAETKKKK